MGKRKDQTTAWQVVAIIIITLALSGCCTFCKQTECLPLIVKPTPPPKEAFIRPKLVIEELPPTAMASETIRAYVLSTDMLISHVLYLEKLLSGYR